MGILGTVIVDRVVGDQRMAVVITLMIRVTILGTVDAVGGVEGVLILA